MPPKAERCITVTNISLGAGAQINAGVELGFSLDNNTITLAPGSSIISAASRAIEGNSGTCPDTIDNAGLIQGGAGDTIDLRFGNDTLILRTGSQIAGNVQAGGAPIPCSYLERGRKMQTSRVLGVSAWMELTGPCQETRRLAPGDLSPSKLTAAALIRPQQEARCALEVVNLKSMRVERSVEISGHVSELYSAFNIHNINDNFR